MHTLDVGGFTVQHNGDFSGDVHIAPKPEKAHDYAAVTLPYWVLSAIVAEKRRQDAISRLEQMGDAELLGYDEDGRLHHMGLDGILRGRL